MNEDQDEYNDENADKLVAEVEAKLAGGAGGGAKLPVQQNQ